MSILQAVHPVPIRYRPRAGAAEQVRFVRHATPVELREADPRDVDPVVHLPGSNATYVSHAGSLWHRLNGHAGPVNRADFEHWLTDPRLAGQQISLALMGTPLLTSQDNFGSRGEDLRIRGIIDDGTERASKALASFLDTNVRMVDDEVHVKARGPLVSFVGDHTLLNEFPVHAPNPRLSVRHDRADDLWDFLVRSKGRDGRYRSMPDLPAQVVAAIDPELLGDVDIDLYVNGCMGTILGILDAYARQRQTAGHRESLMDARARILPHVADGMMGMIERADAERIMLLALDVLTVARVAFSNAEYDGRAWPASFDGWIPLDHQDWIEDVFIPRLNEIPDLSDEDEAAMVGIAP